MAHEAKIAAIHSLTQEFVVAQPGCFTFFAAPFVIPLDHETINFVYRANEKVPGIALQESLDDFILAGNKIDFHAEANLDAQILMRRTYLFDIGREGE